MSYHQKEDQQGHPNKEVPNIGDNPQERPYVESDKHPHDSNNPNEKHGHPNPVIPDIEDNPQEMPHAESDEQPRDPNNPNEKHGHPNPVIPNDGEHAITRREDKINPNE